MTQIDLRQAAAEIQRAALLAADPAEAVRRHVRRVTDWLLVGDVRYHLTEIERVFVVATSKASVAMAEAVADFFDDKIAGSIVVAKAANQKPAMGDMIITGATGTNVNDVLFMLMSNDECQVENSTFAL